MRTALAVVLGLSVLSGCAHKRTTRRVSSPPPAPAANSRGAATKVHAPEAPGPAPSPRTPGRSAGPAPEPGSVETGIASWYGHPYHGRIAANGERYDMEKLTAAHRTLPFETWVRVVNTVNDKTVEVRITDRGPFVDGRIIDLSKAAARAIDMIGPGTARVRVEIMRAPDAAAAGSFAVQVGAYRDRANAERERSRMATRYGAARIVIREGNPTLWRVLVGAESTEEGADALRLKICQDSGERNAFVVRLDS